MVKEWWTLTTDAVASSLKDVAGYVPEILGAIVVILVGVLVAWAVKTVIVKLLGYVKVKPYTDAIGLNKVFKGKTDLVELLGDLAKWIVVIVFLIPALNILGLADVKELVQEVLNYVPAVLKAAVIVVVGTIVADLAARAVEAATQTIGAKTAAIAADIVRWAIIVFVALAALSQLGIATGLIETLVTGAIALIALAGGLAFGLGGQDAARDVIERLRKNLPK